MTSEEKAGVFGFLLLLIIIGFIFCNPLAIVGVGERGVKVSLGKVSPQSFTEGVHFVMPFISKIHKMDVKTQKSNIATIIFTKDIQQARLEYVINYNLQPENVHKMYKEVGKNYKDTILVPVVEGTVKNVVGSYNANDLVGSRAKATSDILMKLQEQLDDNYINVTDFNITNIDYSDSFEKAVEAKTVAEQEALKAKNMTAKVQEEARQKVISAEAEAKAIRIKAEALKQNKDLVNLTLAEKWDGKLSQYMMGNAMPLFNIK